MRFVYHGAAGVMAIIERPDAPWWDKKASLMIPARRVPEMNEWLSELPNNPAKALPHKLHKVLRRIIDNPDDVLSQTDMNTIQMSVEALDQIYNPSDEMNRKSMELRALNR
jgi:hypothetical protein